MSSDTNIIYNVKKPKELVMLGKKLPLYVQLRMRPLILLLFFLFFLLGKLNCKNFNFFFFFHLKMPHKKLGSCVFTNQRQSAGQRLDLTGNKKGQCTYQKKQELPNRFFSLFNPPKSLKLNTLTDMPVSSYCSASCLQPRN